MEQIIRWGFGAMLGVFMAYHWALVPQTKPGYGVITGVGLLGLLFTKSPVLHDIFTGMTAYGGAKLVAAKPWRFGAGVDGGEV